MLLTVMAVHFRKTNESSTISSSLLNGNNRPVQENRGKLQCREVQWHMLSPQLAGSNSWAALLISGFSSFPRYLMSVLLCPEN